jgi:hypothetical protein
MLKIVVGEGPCAGVHPIRDEEDDTSRFFTLVGTDL